MFQRLYLFFTKDIRRKVLLLMLLASLLPLLGVMFYGIYTARGLLYDWTLREQEQHVDNLVSNVERFLFGVREDVLFLSRAQTIQLLIRTKADGDMTGYEAARQRVEDEFLSLAQINGIYYQVRYLDMDGMEIVRVDSDGMRPFVVPHEQLQDKSDRYYFSETLALAPDQVFVSPLDLNVEHGEIEYPYKPVIRYGTPVWLDGRPAGVVIVNVFAARFLEVLGDRALPSEIVALVDEDGYYLYHSDDEEGEKRWGRDLETGITVEGDYPGVLSSIFEQAGEMDVRRSIEVAEYFATYSTFSPPGTNAYRWAVLSIRPQQAVLAPITRFGWGAAIVIVVVLGIAWSAGSWLSARLVRPIEQLQEQVNNLGHGDLETRIRVSTSDQIGTLARSMDQARVDLRQISQNLQDQVASAERRTRELQAAAEVSRAVGAFLDLDELLSRVVMSVSLQFGFYHTAVFLIDEAREWIELQVGVDMQGQQRLQGYRLQVGKEGIVGRVAMNGEAYVVSDIDQDPLYVSHPDLPDTKSEAALPLKARGEIIGVLDIQSMEEMVFDQISVAVLQTLADQVAMAISNARLWQASQKQLQALERAYSEYGQEAWTRVVEAQRGWSYRYRNDQVGPAGDVWYPEMSGAVWEGRVVHDRAEQEALAIPVRIRNQVVGVIDARKPEGMGNWSKAEVDLLQSLVGRLEQALEAAQLYQDTQQRAMREQAIGQITAQFTQAFDMDTLLRVATRELGQLPHVAEVSVHVGALPEREET